MIVRGACPDCERVHALAVAPAAGPGRALAECTHCRRLWPPRGTPTRPDAIAGRCSAHPDVAARWVCESCETSWCEPCSRQVPGPVYDARISPCCREGCLPLASIRMVLPFQSDIGATLAYAARGEGLFVLAFLWFAGWIPILSWFVPLLLVAYGFHVLRSSTREPYASPGFPDPGDIVSDLVFPFVRLIAAGLIAWSPLLLYRRLGPADPAPWLVATGLILGLGVFPTIVLRAVSGETLIETLDPSRIVQTMRSMGGDYVAVVVALAIFAGFWFLTGRIVDRNEMLGLITGPLRLYAVVTAFHILGRSILQTRDRIDWEI